MCSDRAARRPLARPVSGFTLIEAILAIVVVGIGLSGLLLAFETTMRSGADPLVQRQMTAIAAQMLEEMQLKPYAVAANAAPSGCARDTFNDVRDYHGYSSSGICTIDGVSIPELAGYGVSISVGAAALSTAADAQRIVIQVSRGADTYSLVGWRTNYAL